MVRNFEITFDTKPFEALDAFALLARQDYNLGSSGDWFGEFRGGLYGFYARLSGVANHYKDVHAWLPRPRGPTETEYHLAGLLFCSDSAIECFTFALNALGYAAHRSGFRDITDASALRKISPRDISGNIPQSGYSEVFPNLQAHWKSNAELIATMQELHDVSKHRQTIYTGGRMRLDPPEGFYERLGIPDTPAQRAVFWPSAEILLRPEPKIPAILREVPYPLDRVEVLEDLIPRFVSFIDKTGALALRDGTSNIRLTNTSSVQAECRETKLNVPRAQVFFSIPASLTPRQLNCCAPGFLILGP
jgi:hypothetical protein